MDELIERVLVETKRMSVVGAVDEYEQFEDLIELRQQLADLVVSDRDTLSERQKAWIQEINSYDVAMLGEMQRLKDEASAGLNRMTLSKKQFAAYNQVDAYDSILMDKRK